jgi:hypothetical protein
LVVECSILVELVIHGGIEHFLVVSGGENVITPKLKKLISPNVDITNFLYFDVYNIDLSKVMNDYNLNFVLLQTTSKPIIAVKDLNRFLTEKSTAVSLFVDIHIYFPLCDFFGIQNVGQ